MANTEINPFAYNPAAAASLFGAQPPPPEQALPEEDMSQYMPQSQPQPQQAPTSSYEDAFQKAEGQYGLPEGLLSTIGYHESRFNPDAVSPKGATGVMQLMPRTAREYGVNARDPYASIDAAGKKMAGLVKYYNGDIVKAVAAYNYGEGNLNRAIRDAGEDWVSAIPKETQDYVTNVLGGAPTSEQESPKGDTYEIPLSNGGSLHVPVGMSKEQAIAEARAHGIDAVGLRDVPLANGGTLHVPDNMSDEQAVAEAQKADPTTDFSLLKEEGDSRTFGKGLEDVGVTAAKAATGFIQSTIGLVDLLTPGNLGGAVEDAGLDLAKIQEYLSTQYTPQQQEHIKAFADAHGWKAILQAAKDHPQALVTALAESVPQIIGGAGIAKAGLMGAAKVLSKVPAAAPYFAAGIGEAGMGAGAQRESLRVTNPEGEASGKNTEAALLTGAGTGIFGAAGAKLTTALGGIDPMLLISGNARQMAIHELGAAAAKPGFFRSTLVSMLGEGVFQELPQSVVEQLDQNFATDKPLFEGVEDAGVKGAIMGALMGGGGNAISQVAGTTEQAPPPPPPPAPVTPPVSEIPVPPEGGVVAPPVNPLIITPEERARIIAAEHGAEKGSLMGALTDRVNPSELAGAPAEEVVAGAPADIVAGAPAEEVVGEPVAEVAAVEEPIVRGKKEKPVKTEPTWVTDMLGLHKKSGLYKKIATQGLDINNPADHDAIRKITDPVIADLKKAGTITEEQSKILPNYMDAIQQGQTTPIIEGATTDAQQIPSTSPINGDGSTQSQESQAVEDITQAGKGVESGGQGVEAVETGAQEKVTPVITPALVSVAQTILDKYDANVIKSKTGEPSQPIINALYKTAAELGLDIPPDTPHADIANQIEAAIEQPDVTLPKGLTVPVQGGISDVVNKASKKENADVIERYQEHIANGTLSEAEGDVVELHNKLRDTNRPAWDKTRETNRINKEAKEVAQPAVEEPIEAPITNADVEASDLAALINSKRKRPVTEAAITDTIQEADLNPEDDNYLSEQGDDFSGYDYFSVAPTSETTGHTATSLSETLSPEMKRLVASGKAVIHDTAETLPEGTHPENVQGLTTAEGVTHYVANKLTPETLENVALHEVGTHVGMENLVGPEVYKDITHQALNNVGEAFDKARAAIPKDTPTHLRHHEALAYLVQNAPHLPVVKKIVSAVRNFARVHLGMKIQLTEADARHLAIKALRKESKTTKRTARKEGTAYSIKPSQDAQDIGASLNAAHLVKSSDKSFITSIKEGLASLKTGNNIVKLRAGWVDKTAGLSRLLKPLDMFDAKGTLRADMLIQAIEQLYNVIRNSDGYLVYAGDGTLMSVADKRLALEDIFKRIDALGYKDSRKTFFTAMRVLTGEQSLLKDAEQRIEAANYKTFAGLLQKDLDKLTGALVDTRRALAAAAVSGDKAAVASLKKDIQVINEEHTKLSRRIAQLKKESNRLFRKHGKKSAVDIQADIDAKETKAQAKEALAATTTDKTKRDALLDQVERLRNDADRLAKVLEAGVGTEKRVDAQQIAEVKELLAKDPRLEPIMGDIWEGLRKLVDLWEVGGLIDAPIANEWRDNPAYIPLYKSMDDLLDDPSGYVEILKVGAKQLGEVKAREGGKHSVNVGENLIKHQAFMAGAAAQNTARRIAVEQMSSMSPDTVYKSGPDDPQATMFRVNGEKVYYHISDPVAFEAFQTMLPILPTWAKVAQVHTRAFRAVTLVNPLYWYRQLIRDPMMASLVTQSGLITPLHAAYHMAKILSGVSKEYKTLKRHGIVGAVDSLTDPKQFVQGIAAKRGIKKKAIDVLMHIHESTDAATRVAVYKAAYKASLKKGIIDPQKRENYAAMQAREVINFSKKGNAKSIATIRATIPFFSAQLNGMDTLARAAMPGSYGNLNAKDAATVRKHFYANAAMLTTASILYALQMDDDEEYKKSPDWLNSWLVPTGNKDNPFIKIPIPFEAGFCFKVVPEILVRVAKYSLTPKEGVEALGTAAKTLLLPPMIPQLFKPLAEVITNYDLHTGNNIESYTESKLPLNQRTAHATPLAEVIAKGVPDFLNMSPDKIEHLGKGWLTEAWALSALIAEAYLNTTGTSAPTKELGEQFLWKGIYTAPAKDVNLTKYYNLSKAAEQIVSGVRAYRKEGSREEAKAMKAEPESKALLKAAPMFDAAGEQIGAMQAHINRIKHKPDSEMSPDEKAKRIRIIQERINKRADRAIERADKIGVER